MFSRHETEESVPKRVVISELVQYEALAKKINGPLHNIFATVCPNEHDPDNQCIKDTGSMPLIERTYSENVYVDGPSNCTKTQGSQLNPLFWPLNI